MIVDLKQKSSPEKQLNRLFAGISGILITAAIAVAVAPQAHARPVETVSRGVKYDDLDLTKDRDVTKLERRIRLAARHLCTLPGGSPMDTYSIQRRCERNAVSDALPRMNQRVAFYRNKRRALDQQAISMR